MRKLLWALTLVALAGPSFAEPTPHHHPVIRYWTPEEFAKLEDLGYRLGFQHVASGPLVRSSYHADQMAHAAGYVNVA